MSKFLIQESPLTFQPSLAVAIGLNEAIVLQQIHYWINNPKNKGYEQDGFKWVYNTYKQWQEENFPFWSENTIQRVFSSLEEKGLVIAIQPMKSKYDRTKYYRIDYPKLEIFDDPKLVSSLDESEITPEITQKPDLVDLALQQKFHLDAVQQATDSFERELGVGSWAWDSTPELRRLKKFVVAEYEKDPLVWHNYKLWREGNGKYAAMSNVKIRTKPDAFIDTGFPTFAASFSMYGTPESARPEYTPVPPDPNEEKYVPIPEHLRRKR